MLICLIPFTLVGLVYVGGSNLNQSTNNENVEDVSDQFLLGSQIEILLGVLKDLLKDHTEYRYKRSSIKTKMENSMNKIIPKPLNKIGLLLGHYHNFNKRFKKPNNTSTDGTKNPFLLLRPIESVTTLNDQATISTETTTLEPKHSLQLIGLNLDLISNDTTVKHTKNDDILIIGTTNMSINLTEIETAVKPVKDYTLLPMIRTTVEPPTLVISSNMNGTTEELTKINGSSTVGTTNNSMNLTGIETAVKAVKDYTLSTMIRTTVEPPTLVISSNMNGTTEELTKINGSSTIGTTNNSMNLTEIETAVKPTVRDYILLTIMGTIVDLQNTSTNSNINETTITPSTHNNSSNKNKTTDETENNHYFIEVKNPNYIFFVIIEYTIFYFDAMFNLIEEDLK